MKHSHRNIFVLLKKRVGKRHKITAISADQMNLVRYAIKNGISGQIVPRTVPTYHLEYMKKHVPEIF